jgi:hypothetical protein
VQLRRMGHEGMRRRWRFPRKATKLSLGAWCSDPTRVCSQVLRMLTGGRFELASLPLLGSSQSFTVSATLRMASGVQYSLADPLSRYAVSCCLLANRSSCGYSLPNERGHPHPVRH